jgi:hypothetical protein
MADFCLLVCLNPHLSVCVGVVGVCAFRIDGWGLFLV